MAALSRIQLAASLIEYDNYENNTDERRNARHSAILANLPPTSGFGAPRRRIRPEEHIHEPLDEDEADARRPGRASPPPASLGKGRDRRSWVTVIEPHLVPVKKEPLSHPPPSPPPDFRRSASPFMKELSGSEPPTPDYQVERSSMTAFQDSYLGRPGNQGEPAEEEVISSPVSVAPLSSMAGPRPTLSAPVPTKGGAAPFALQEVFTVGTASSITTSAPPPVRPPSTPALKSYAPLSSSPLSHIPLQDAPMSRSTSFGALSGSPSRSCSVPLELQLRDQSTSLFAVPFFENPLPPPPKRNKSPFRFLSPKTSPSASNALLPDAIALRDAISALPRSLGGDPPSGDHRRGMGPRARTGSMGDWEDLVFQAHEDFKSDSPLSNLRSFGSRSAAASQVFFDEEVDGVLAGPGGTMYGQDGTIRKPRAQSMDMLSTTTRPVLEEAVRGRFGEPLPIQRTLADASSADPHPTSATPVAPPMIPALSGVSEGFSTVGDSPVVVPSPLPISPRPQEAAERISWETVARPLADLAGLSGVPVSEDDHRRSSLASSVSAFDMISSSKFGKTPPALSSELPYVEPDTSVAPRPKSVLSRGRPSLDSTPEVRARTTSLPTDSAPAEPRPSSVLSRGRPSMDGRPDSRARKTSFLGDLSLVEEQDAGKQEAVDEKTARPESSMSLLDEIGRMTPGLLAETNGRDTIGEVRRSLQQLRLSRHADDGEDGEEYLAGDDAERERENWLPPPSKGRTSRFDPSNGRPRTASFHGLPEEDDDDDDDDDEPLDTRRQPGKPKSAGRPTSLAHFKQSGRFATTATSSIHLPAVLVMPTLLDPAAYTEEPQQANSRGFFETSTKPLPADFRTRPPINHSRSSSSFVASASALAIPTKRLTLAQKTFRASLVVDGKRGNEFLGSALEEGEKAFEEGDDDDDGSDRWMLRPENDYRGAGTLYGRSLMDTLEQRKVEMSQRKRVFRGDSRPSMFTRSTTEATFISAPSIRGRPQSVHLNPTFPKEELDASGVSSGMKTRGSVFGLDKHWQDAMAEREAEDTRLAEIERRREEAEEIARKAAEDKRISKLKGKKRVSNLPASPSTLQLHHEDGSPVRLDEFGVDPGSPTGHTRASVIPPSLSLGNFADSEAIEGLFSPDDGESTDEGRAPQLSPIKTVGSRKQQQQRTSRVFSRAGWISSDEEEGEGGPEKKKGSASPKAAQLPEIQTTRDETSSDDDLPLTALVNRGSLRPSTASLHLKLPSSAPLDDSSDDDIPLTQINTRKSASLHPRSPHSPHHSQAQRSPVGQTAVQPHEDGDDDDDDVPLGDLVPLGLSQAQRLQQQYYHQQAAMAQQQQVQAQMFAIQQQQHQQMIMAQMMGGGSMYGMPGFGLSMPNLQQPHPVVPPQDDKIARWRQEVPME